MLIAMYYDLITSAQSRLFRLGVANTQASPGQHLYLGRMSGIILFWLLLTMSGRGHAQLEALGNQPDLEIPCQPHPAWSYAS